MSFIITEFDSLEQQFVDLIGEFKTTSRLTNEHLDQLMSSECRVRELLRTECSRAESAEAARDAAERAATEARTSASAAAAAAAQAATTLNTTYEQITDLKTQLDLSEHQRKALEERCSELSKQTVLMERELYPLRQLQTAHTNLQHQYIQLQERVNNATEDARREKSQLENELRRVEKCAAGGMEIRERARLAAAAHARERRLVAAELQHVSRELAQANAEITKLRTAMAEQQFLSSHFMDNAPKMKIEEPDKESLSELRALLEVERTGTEKLERALAAALADNLTLAAQLHVNDNGEVLSKSPVPSNAPVSTNICPIDSFLAE